MANTADLKSAAVRLEGSSPSQAINTNMKYRPDYIALIIACVLFGLIVFCINMLH